MIPPDCKSGIHKTMGPIKDSYLDDYIGFSNLNHALTALGIANNEKMKLFETLAGILHLGNVNFEEDMEGCKISNRSEESLELAASLLYIDISELRKVLISKVIAVGNTKTMCVT